MKLGRTFITAVITGMMLISAGCTDNNQKSKIDNQHKTDKKEKKNSAGEFPILEAKHINIEHIHGLGYPGNDTGLYIASHDGLKIHNGSKWYETSLNRHDYMGFQAINKGFIASGHPQKGTALKNPLGLIESNDKGKHIKKLAFYGESDFHFLAGSFNDSGIYIINEQPNGTIKEGVYFSNNHGKKWHKSKLGQFTADSLGMIAVHPEKAETMAMATRTGIYYSIDAGDTMKLITDPVMVTSLAFSKSSIYYSEVGKDSISLKRILPETKQQTDVKIPFLEYTNPITYLAIDHKNPQRIAFSTYNNDVYESTDGGINWTLLLTNGQKQQD